MCVLVIYVAAGDCCVVVLKLNLLAQLGLLTTQLIGNRLPLCSQQE